MKSYVKEDKFAESKRILLDLNATKNEDVLIKLLNRDKIKYNKVTDYICDAIRAFEGNNNVNMGNIENIIEKMMDEKLKNLNFATEVNKEEIVKSLEDDIENVDCDED